MATQVGPVDVTLEATTISPANFCPTTEQERLNKYAQHLTGVLPGGYSTFVIGNEKPLAVDQNKAWLRLDSAGRPERWYTFANGSWQSPHPVPPGFIQLYMGSITSIGNFDRSDGSTGSTISENTGPFWEELKDLRPSGTAQPFYGRCAVHPDPSGALVTNQTVSLVPAGGSGTGNRLVFASTGGQERHTLVRDEIPDHTHLFTGSIKAINNGTSTAIAIYAPEPTSTQNSTLNGGGADLPHQNMPPFFVAYYIRRTARTHYRVNP